MLHIPASGKAVCNPFLIVMKRYWQWTVTMKQQGGDLSMDIY